MDEAAARGALNVSRETMERLECFVDFLRRENEQQNLVSRGTLDAVWSRHILDSAQLLTFAHTPDDTWLDLGAGAGFPGLVIGLLHRGAVTLIEERKRRAQFLEEAAEILGIEKRVTIHCGRVERFESPPFDVISARAFAPLGRLFGLSHSFSTVKTRWILPKGRNAASELEAAKASWQGEFRLEQSITDADAQIIVAERVRPEIDIHRAMGKGAR